VSTSELPLVLLLLLLTLPLPMHRPAANKRR
jgi:hypothetical protein